MYAIATVIYGIPLTEEVNDFLCESEEYGDPESAGFVTMYSGSCAGHMPGFLGVDLGSFDEGDPVIDLSDPGHPLNVVPTEAQCAEANALVESLLKILPPAAAAAVPKVGRYLVWSTS